MAKSLLTDKLVETVKIRSAMPDNNVVFSNQEIIDILNEELDISILPKILDVHEEYYLYHEDIDFSNEVTTYRIPYRSIGNKLREVQLIDSTGTVHELTRIEVDDLPDYQDNFSMNRSNVFYVKNDYIILPNASSVGMSGGSIRMYFFLRPNELVTNAEGAVISGINRTTGVISLSNFPTAFSTETVFDFISHRSSHKIYLYDIPNGTVDSTNKTITFPVSKSFTTVNTATDLVTFVGHGYYTGMLCTLTSDGTLPTGLSTATEYYVIKIDDDSLKFASSLALAQAGTAVDITGAGSGNHTVVLDYTHIPSELIIGDHVCLAEETIVPQLPSELHSYLAQQAASVCVESIGDDKEVAIMNSKLAKMEKNTIRLIDNRVEGAPQKVNPRHNLLRSNKRFR